MGNLQSFVDRFEIEALRGESTDTAAGRAYIAEFGTLRDGSSHAN
ncbi:hypothetical protein [Streptomyces sp. NPDC021622]